ncbi:MULTISPECIES: LysR family transcriptional regulator [Vibrio]|uniref:LysR family transcriptional regulator n=2 Tax=Vibrio TaxID=662 RepID=A0A7X4RWM3_9VIBR|nr:MULTISPECIES: LysR family transcriptional regulator [Vibrio]MBF9001008.1 LysR family transcriptional regulator [Vibrio nitrifigilis]MZI95497.1 LysR family transcriptional regulator [Vibrio eleionomae]
MNRRIPTTIKRLEIFISYMEQNNMGQVAEAMDINTLSVYRSIHALEEDLGCVLFEKRGRSLVPLESANILYQQCVSALSDLSRAIDNTQISAGITPKKIRVGSVNSLTVDLVPHLLTAYKERRPDVQLEFHSGSNSELVEKLKRSELDVLMVYGDHHLENSPHHTAMKLFDDMLSFTIAHCGEQPGKSEVPIKADYLKKQSYMTLTKGFGLREAFDKVIAKLDSKVDIHSEFSSIFGLSFALKSGAYAALLPSRLAEVSHQIGLEFYPLSPELTESHGIYLLMNRASEHNPAIRALIAECRMYSLRWQKSS